MLCSKIVVIKTPGENIIKIEALLPAFPSVDGLSRRPSISGDENNLDCLSGLVLSPSLHAPSAPYNQGGDRIGAVSHPSAPCNQGGENRSS